MRGSEKLKRVSWPSDGNLCQVKLFLAEESPSQIKLVNEEHLQPKVSSRLDDSSKASAEEVFPPGFGDGYSFENLSPCNWNCPYRFSLNIMWKATAGEESTEKEAQTKRELGVLEAVYPRPSAIPPNSSVSSDVEEDFFNDELTPLIHITAMEELDSCSEPSSSLPDSSFVAMIKDGFCEEVLRILRNPKVTEVQAAAVHVAESDSLVGPPPGFEFCDCGSGGAPFEKAERNNCFKVNKPCMYFNSSRGCWRGASCAYQHDGSAGKEASRVDDDPDSKRLKADRGFNGTLPCI